MTRLRGLFSGLLICRNPWAGTEFGSGKPFYLRWGPPWMFKKPAPDFYPNIYKVNEAFSKAAKEVARDIPSDGTFGTLHKRLKKIREKLEGKTYVTRAHVEAKYVPEYASSEYKESILARY